MGTLLNVEYTSSMAPLILGGESMTRMRTSENVPHSHGKSLESIWSLIEVMSGLFRGYEKSCIKWSSPNEPALGTTPRGEDLKGLIRASRWQGEKGPV